MKVKFYRLIGERDRVLKAVYALLGGSLAISTPEFSRVLLWGPVALGVGAAAYFSWPVEPEWPLFGLSAGLGVILILISAALMRAFQGGVIATYLLCLGLSAFLGFGLALHRAQSLSPPDLSAFTSERSAHLTGWIEKIDRIEGRPRAIIRVHQLEHAETAPYRVRIRLGLDGFEPGDAIVVRVRLQRPGGPVAAGGYDPGRAAWFEQIALTGYAISSTQPAVLDSEASLARALARLRWRMAETIRSAMEERTGAIGAALLTGERAFVSGEDAEALRISGLGHILAISGLHMALFAGGAYWLARYLLAGFDRYARAHDPRKLAALIALIAATAYLVLSGGSVSTQRAYVMTLVVLLGVMLNRRAFSMRSLALAALVVLITAPESVIEPGFQMSFAAVAALIASYDSLKRLQANKTYAQTGLLGRAWSAIAGLSATSLIAGAATGAFAAFHFQRMAIYGLIANLAAMPVFTFWVMPAGGLAMVSIPFGLEAPALWVMDQGLAVVLAIAHWTAGLNGAAFGVTASPSGLVAIYGLGFALCMVGLGSVRLMGAGVMVLALGLSVTIKPPDLMVTDAGVVVARFEGEDGYAATPSRRDRFETGVFFQRLGLSGPQTTELVCDDLGCVGLTEDGLRLAITASPQALADDCQMADIVIYEGEASSWRRRRCEAVLLDDQARAQLGGAEFWIKDGAVIRLRSALSDRHNRIWAQPF